MIYSTKLRLPINWTQMPTQDRVAWVKQFITTSNTMLEEILLGSVHENELCVYQKVTSLYLSVSIIDGRDEVLDDLETRE